MEKQDLSLSNLSFFNGTENYYVDPTLPSNRYYTDGIKYVISNGYAVLIKDIYLALLELEKSNIIKYSDFIVVSISKKEDSWSFHILREKDNFEMDYEDTMSEFDYSDILFSKTFSSNTFLVESELKFFYQYCGLIEGDKVLFLSSEY